MSDTSCQTKITLEPNKQQGVFAWCSMGYQIRKDLINEICMDWVEDVGCLTPIMLNHIKWIIQRTIFDLETYDSSNIETGDGVQPVYIKKIKPTNVKKTNLMI